MHYIKKKKQILYSGELENSDQMLVCHLPELYCSIWDNAYPWKDAHEFGTYLMFYLKF